ncbi:MAG: hypothetical protein WD691_07930 [Acidimicrobiales bacterium]
MRPRTRPRAQSWRRPRVGLALRREPRLWWAVVVSLALSAGWLASEIVSGAEQTRRAWGTERLVLVARHDLDAGDNVDAGDVELVARPAALIPATALERLPADPVLRVDVIEGEVLVAQRLAPSGLQGAAARLPAGTLGVAIPIDSSTTPPLTPGDRVDILVALPRDTAGNGPPGFTLTAAALVVAVDDASATIAVPRDLAPRVAVALGEGAVFLALVGA